MFNCIAAFAKTSQQAQMMAIPPLMFCIIFNGFFVTLAGVQDWMIWAIYISPMFYGFQEIVVGLFDVDPPVPVNSTAYRNSGTFVIDTYEYKTDFAGPAIAVLAAYNVIFRCLQVYALKHRNNPEK